MNQKQSRTDIKYFKYGTSTYILCKEYKVWNIYNISFSARVGQTTNIKNAYQLIKNL